jgi:hypothetical protein
MNTESSNSADKPKLKPHEHIVAGLPLVLLIVGGAIGGAVGGGAYACSAAVFKKDISNTKKYIYSLLITFGAVAAYFGLIILLATLFPGLFNRK